MFKTIMCSLLRSPIQFQSFVMFRGKLKARTSEEIQTLKESPKIWNIHSILNVLYSLVDKSNINKQVSYYQSVVQSGQQVLEPLSLENLNVVIVP